MSRLSFLKKKRFWIPAIIVILVGGWIMYSRNANKGPFYDTQTVQRGDIQQTVEVTGEVKPDTRVDLSFKGSGKLVQLKTVVGQPVKTGDVLAQLDTRDQSFAVVRARASLLAAQADYDRAVAGASLTDVQVSQTAVDAAQVTLDNAKRSFDQTKSQQELLVKNAYTTLLNSGVTATPGPSNISKDSPTISGTYTGTIEGQSKIRLYQAGGSTRFIVDGLEMTEGLVNTVSPVAFGARGLSIQFPTSVLYESDSWTIDIPNKRSSAYLTNLNAYQAALQTQSQAMSTAQNTVNSAQASLEQMKAALNQKKAPPRPVDIAALRAQVLSAQAGYGQAAAQLADAKIIAPADGVISQIVPHVGEQVMSNVTAITLVVSGGATVEILLPEADVAKVQVSQTVTMTLDAFGDDKKFTGRVLKIDPDQTKVQDAVYYKAEVTLETGGAAVKPGMTVNVTVLTGEKKAIVFIPSRAIQEKNGEKMVRVLQNNQPVDRKVELGLRGDEGRTEVVSGLNEGESVILGELTAQEYAQKQAGK